MTTKPTRSTTLTNSTAQQSAARRRTRVKAAVHSSAMEGLAPSPEWENDAELYVQGRISVDQLVSRTRARYGLTD